jgi:hypothetical protein
MLGSEHAGERAAAALHAEAFRKRHGLSWEGMLALPPVEAEPAPRPPEPPSPPTSRQAQPKPQASRAARAGERWWSNNAPEHMKAVALVIAWISLPVLLTVFL